MFCQKCGTAIPEGDRFCPTCGEPVPGAEAPKAPDLSDHTEMFTEEDKERTRLLAALTYLNFLFGIVGLIVEPNSKFIRYHLNQSLMLSVFGILCGLVMIIPFIGWIVGVVGSVAVIVFTVMGIVRSLNREAKDLPLIGKYKIVYYD